MVSPVVSITFRGPDGRRIPMPSLAKPMSIRLFTNSSAASCAFWDEENAIWSARGLSRLSFEDGVGLLCQTTHLTLFGAVLDAFLRVLQCSTASEVFSSEGFQNIGRGEWLPYTPSIVTFSAARMQASDQCCLLRCAFSQGSLCISAHDGVRPVLGQTGEVQVRSSRDWALGGASLSLPCRQEVEAALLVESQKDRPSCCVTSLTLAWLHETGCLCPL